eukprot:29026-Pelagococcus_subviridis.AAC.10
MGVFTVGSRSDRASRSMRRTSASASATSASTSAIFWLFAAAMRAREGEGRSAGGWTRGRRLRERGRERGISRVSTTRTRDADAGGARTSVQGRQRRGRAVDGRGVLQELSLVAVEYLFEEGAWGEARRVSRGTNRGGKEVSTRRASGVGRRASGVNLLGRTRAARASDDDGERERART